MYNAHRGMAAMPTQRLNELLDQIRAEFENQQNRSGEYEQQRTYHTVDVSNCLSFGLSHLDDGGSCGRFSPS